MKTKVFFVVALIGTLIPFMSFTQNKTKPMLKEESVTYQADGITLKGFVVYDESNLEKRPAILVVHEWWGLNEYAKNRARQLAALGYLAMAVDMFGNGDTATNPKQAQEMTSPFYSNPQLAKSRLDAALKKVKEYKQTNGAHVAAIGYCFGGYAVLNYAKLGADLKGVVSFHGGLKGVPANKELLKAKILVCNGAADKVVSLQDIDAFKHAMDSIGADYTFKSYANATHAFTNQDATRTGKQFNMPIEYNAAADKASWSDMQTFLSKLFKK